jgi:hypothetical protein
MDPFTIAYDALLRPTRFAALLDSGGRAIVRAALAVLLWVGAALAFVGLILAQLAPLGMRGLVAGLALAPALALFIAGVGVMVGGGGSSTQAHAAFWVLRCQVAITPPLALLLALTFSQAFASLQRSPAIVLLFLFLVGMWLGGGITVILVLHRRRDESVAVRWVVASGALAIGGALWWSQPLRASEALLFAPVCSGLMFGLIRPVSYLCEAPLSIGLALAARLGAAPLRLLLLHPAYYDELGLLPLPGLSGLLMRGCAADLDAGGAWLVRVAQHPGRRRVAEQSVERAARDPRLAHTLLFWLSTSEEGMKLLTDIAERARNPHPLIAAYAAFADVATPDLWPFVLARQREAIVGAVQQPGGRAVLALLEVGIATLRADRWPDAVARLEAAPPSGGVEPDPIWAALAAIQTWATDPAPMDIADRAAATWALVAELQNLDGWPIALIAAMCEHLLFLFGIERHRGAWLV